MLSFSKHTIHPFWFSFIVSLALVSLYNIPFWNELWEIQNNYNIRTLTFIASFPIFIISVLVICFSIFSLLHIQQYMAALLFPVAASGLYFMMTYNIMIDRTMIENTMQTEAREVRDLLSLTLFLYLVFLGFLPAYFALKIKLAPLSIKKKIFIHGGTILACIAIIGIIAIPFYRDYASTFRNHKEIRYFLNPSNSLSSVVRYVSKDVLKSNKKMVQIGLDAAQIKPSSDKRNLIILVVGEAARAQSFSLFGYKIHDTNPLLEKRKDIIPLSNLSSCGTTTAISVPCMFSPFTRQEYSKSKFDSSENVVDILQHAGLNLYWRDNNSSCKGVCSRIKNDNVVSDKNKDFCYDGECFDTILLDNIDAEIPNNNRDTVIIIHQKGSHGPAYYKRVPSEFKKFLPECRKTELQDCSPDEIRNSYDNTILYTDNILNSTIEYLKSKSKDFNTALIYMSDHGQSLGEKGLYLHGMPYMFAPEEQTHPAGLLWLSDEFYAANGIDNRCLTAKAKESFSHDNLFHTLLGINHIQTSIYNPKLDILDGCYASKIEYP